MSHDYTALIVQTDGPVARITLGSHGTFPQKGKK